MPADNEPDESSNAHEVERAYNGRSIEIDTGFYHIEVTGDPDDSFEAVLDCAERVADRAKEDVEELDDRLDSDNRHYS